MAAPSHIPSIPLADLQKTVEQLPEAQQQEVLWLVQELTEGTQATDPAIIKAQAQLAQERIARAKAHPETQVDAQVWLQTEREKRGW